MNSLRRFVFTLPAERRLSVLIFHRVLAAPDPLFADEMDSHRFDTLLGWVRTWFNVLPLDEAARRLQDGSLPARAAALTFDDGYADNHNQALPILKRHGLPCTFFIATGFLDGGRMWNDTIIESIRACPSPALDLRGLQTAAGQTLDQYPVHDLASRRATVQALITRVKYLAPVARQLLVDAIAERAQVRLPTDLMMTSEQVRALRRAGMQIGAHTVSHPILASLQHEQAREEMRNSKHQLETLLGEKIKLFAYPNGKPGVDYLPHVHPAIAEELGFEAAVSTHWGTARAGVDPFQLPRFTPWDRSGLKFGLRMARNLMI